MNHREKRKTKFSTCEFGHIMEHSHFNVSHMCSWGWCCRLRQNDEGKSRTCISSLASGDTENVMIVPWQRASCKIQLQSRLATKSCRKEPVVGDDEQINIIFFFPHMQSYQNITKVYQILARQISKKYI